MNRLVRPVMFAFEPDVVHVFCEVSFGATGAPTLNTTKSKGVCNIARNSSGNYTITFGSQFTPVKRLDAYTKLLSVQHCFNTAGTSAAPASPSMYVTANSVTSATSASVTIQFNAAGTATDPASGEVVYLKFDLSRSTAI